MNRYLKTQKRLEIVQVRTTVITFPNIPQYNSDYIIMFFLNT